MKRPLDILRSDSGVSVSELLVVTVLLSILISTTYFSLVAAQGIANRIEGRVIASDEARIGVERMSRELRQAQELNEGQGVFSQADSRACTFWADVNQDGRPEKIRYYVSGTSVFRQEALPTTALPPYSFGTYSSPIRMIASLDPTWTDKIFTYLGKGSTPAVLGSSDIPKISALNVRVVNLATVGNRQVRVDESTWVKIRSVHSAVQ